MWRLDQADPFGVAAPNENPTSLGTFTYNLRFPGQVCDAETGKYYNVNRDYDPASGRYVQSDPIGLAAGQPSTYAYVDGKPASSVDPFGLASCTFTLSTGRLICTLTNSQNSSVNIPVASGNNGGGHALSSRLAGLPANSLVEHCQSTFSDLRRRELADVPDVKVGQVCRSEVEARRAQAELLKAINSQVVCEQ